MSTEYVFFSGKGGVGKTTMACATAVGEGQASAASVVQRLVHSLGGELAPGSPLQGRSEQVLGELLRANPGKRLYTASKIPPKNRIWPSRRGFALADGGESRFVHKQTA